MSDLYDYMRRLDKSAGCDTVVVVGELKTQGPTNSRTRPQGLKYMIVVLVQLFLTGPQFLDTLQPTKEER